MKIKNYGKAALFTSIFSWLFGISFTLFANQPIPDQQLFTAVPAIAVVAFPGSIAAIIFAIIAVAKKQKILLPIIGLITSAPLFLICMVQLFKTI